MKILITGSSGFIGSSLVKKLAMKDFNVVAISRNAKTPSSVSVEIDENTDFSDHLPGVDCVIHLAALVHVMDNSGYENIEKYRRLNVDTTLNLAKQSLNFGVKRFIFLSSIKVNGEVTENEKKFCAEDIPNPQDAYSLSKMEAEIALKKVCKGGGMSYTIIRPPLVYGFAAKGNFLSLIRLIMNHIPLPVKSIKNKRSLVYVENLVDLILTVINHPAAVNQIFLVSDNHDVSISVLVRKLAGCLNRWHIQVPVPAKLINWFFLTFKNVNYANRILGSLEVDITKNIILLKWLPPINFDDAIASTTKEYLRSIRRNS